MMKYLKTICCMAILALFLTACGGSKDITVDVEKLANELQSKTVTSDTLAATAPERASIL